MTISETADRLWEALCELRASEGVVLKDAYCRRVTEILAAEEATVEIKPKPGTGVLDLRHVNAGQYLYIRDDGVWMIS